MELSELVNFPLDGGGTILVEVERVVERPAVRGGRVGASVSQAEATLQEVIGRLGPLVQNLTRQLRSQVDSPDQIEVEFGVKISSDANLVIARAGGEANFRIVMSWGHKQNRG